MGIGGAAAGAMALLALGLVPWGALGPGTALGSALTGLPVQEIARKSPGAGITAMQMITALRRGVLVPYQKQQAEGWKTARQLIRSGADPRAANLFGATPMTLAATRGDAAMIQVLLDAGVDVDSPNEAGQTALRVVARTGNRDPAQLLIKRQA